MTNPFEGPEDVEVDETAVEVEDLDVETVEDDEDAAEDTVEATPTEGKEKAPKAKKEKTPARPPVAEGYVTPVAFAKLLTKHLESRGAENKKGPINDSNPMPPQQVYSYIRNNQGGKNPLPIYTDPALTGGREYVLKPEEALAWWDEKDERITTSKTAKAEKEKAKAEKAASKAEDVTEAEAAEVGEVEEAE